MTGLSALTSRPSTRCRRSGRHAGTARRPTGRSPRSADYTEHVLPAPVQWLALALAAMPIASFASPSEHTEAAHPDVLLIFIDDLNDWVGYLGGHPQAQTPNIDRLAARGAAFTNAHAAAPTCTPSRTAIFTGLRPTTTGVIGSSTDWAKVDPLLLTLPSAFGRSGYQRVALQKVDHEHWATDWDHYQPGFQNRSRPTLGKPIATFHIGPIDGVDADHADHRAVVAAIERLRAHRDQPLLLAVGLRKPHLPIQAPKAYFDAFPIEEVEFPAYREDDLDDVPRIAHHRPGWRRSAAAMASPRRNEIVQAYLATVAFIDAQIGLLIDALDQSPNAGSTIVVLASDHGWHLGEKGYFGKTTLWEETTHVPFIIFAPGVTTPGSRIDRAVDLVHFAPTVSDLAGVPFAGDLDGTSLRPLLEDPNAPWDRPAITTGDDASHAVRTDRWRYIRYRDGSEELYDHSSDPHEWVNLAGSADHARLLVELRRHLPKSRTWGSEPLRQPEE